MDCRQVKEVVFRYIDNEMDADLLLSFRNHVALCAKCRQHVSGKEWVVIRVRRCRRTAAPVRLRRRILTSLPHRRI
jgi:mycothiol system anti-sigma-R factor